MSGNLLSSINVQNIVNNLMNSRGQGGSLIGGGGFGGRNRIEGGYGFSNGSTANAVLDGNDPEDKKLLRKAYDDSTDSIRRYNRQNLSYLRGQEVMGYIGFGMNGAMSFVNWLGDLFGGGHSHDDAFASKGVTIKGRPKKV